MKMREFRARRPLSRAENVNNTRTLFAGEGRGEGLLCLAARSVVRLDLLALSPTLSHDSVLCAVLSSGVGEGASCANIKFSHLQVEWVYTQFPVVASRRRSNPVALSASATTH